MHRFIITGTPGAGKTTIVRHLEQDGFSVVDEAATDVIAAAQASGIAQPWTHASFIDEVAALQHERQIRAEDLPDGVQFHDRSVVCTAALADYLGHQRSSILMSELERVRAEAIFERRVFLVRPLGFIRPSDARRITYEEALAFEHIHERAYRELGYALISIEPGPVHERVARIRAIACPR